MIEQHRQQRDEASSRHRRRVAVVSAVLALVLSVVGGVVRPAPVLADTPGDQVVLLVGFEASTPAAARRALHAEAAGRRVHTIAGLGVDVVRVAVDKADSALSRYRSRGVAFAERNITFRTAAEPDDPLYAGHPSTDLYGLHNTGTFGGLADEDIDAPEGWDLLGLPTAGPWPRSGYAIGVVDTGVDGAHPDLAGRIAECVQARAGTGAVSPGCSDPEGHGTHVAGTIAAIGNNATGVIGAAPDADVAMCAALDASGTGFSADIAGCIDHLVSRAAELSLRVINLSLGSTAPSEVVRLAVEGATAAGILVVAAAGNDGASTRNYPASHPEALSVAAVDRSGDHAEFSNHNGEVDLAAPGVGVVSAMPGGGYAEMDGTSMATPHVAAVAGLVAHHHGLNAADLRARLETTAEDKGAPGRDSAFGHGRVNLCRALLGTTCGTSKPPLPAADGPIIDPGFEYGPDNPHWSEYDANGVEVISNDAPAAGTFSADLCGYNSCYAELTHTFEVPVGVVDADLSYLLGGATEGLGCADYLAVGVADAAGNPISYNTHCSMNRSSLGPSIPESRDLTTALEAREGQTLMVFLVAETDASARSRWWVDDVTLNVVTSTVPPGAPTGVAATAGDASATVSWVAPADTGDSDLTGYTVTASPGGATASADGATTTATVGGLANGTAYTFTVTATNLAGTGPPSAPSGSVTPSAATGPPSPPQITRALAEDSQVSVSWAAPTDEGGSAVTAYRLTASPGGHEVILGAAARAGVIAGLSNGTSYDIALVAVNAAGASAPDVVAGVVPRTVPEAPVAPSAAAGPGEATVSWSAPSSNGGASITAYRVRVLREGAVQATLEVSDPAQRTLRVAPLENGRSHTFQVAAVNAAGQGAWSAESAAVVPKSPPGAPTSVTATPGDGQVTIGWGPPAHDGGAPVTGYRVIVSSEGAVAANQLLGSSQRSVVIGGLTNGRSYTVSVSAVNAAGAGPGGTAGPVTPFRSLAGYWMASSAGHVWAFGDAQHHGDTSGFRLNREIVDLEPIPDGRGYWMVQADGGIFTFGSAAFHGSAAGVPLPAGERVASMSATPTGGGYWIFTNRGRVFAFGDAPFLGDMSGVALNGPVLGSVGTPSGRGYYMVASDGGIFAFGDARFVGSMGGQRLNQPVQGLVPDGDGTGYWLVASDGGVFAFDAPFRGSMGATQLNKPINGMVRFGNGYLMVASDGGIFNFSDKPFFGSLGGQQLPAPVVTVAAFGT